MRIAVYPGSFDPLHIGHKAIMEYLTNDSGFDWVYLVISPQNPFKEPEKALNAEQRYRDAIAAARRNPELHVWVDNIELSMDPPHYTIRTLDALRVREPENEFTLVVGADNLERILQWRESFRILTEYGIAVYPRLGYDVEALRESVLEQQPLSRIEIINAPIINISSTRIREGLANGEDMSSWLM
ncbi:MAG: nicotinate (nicotinamide) nucleotide adenylyltransferase [Bacteroidales bacterium]|nr:nicotinate (nicotinamide) nucleotide adenylyltransferase [Bacteroidales bacterium]